MPPGQDDYRWLLGEEAAGWLARAAQADLSTVQLAGRMRKQLSAERAHLVLEQVELRRRGCAKFPAAGRMFFTAVGLEQATDQAIAAYKAARFPLAGSYADLCCGVGGDLVALAARGVVVGVDRDPVTGSLAEANIAAHDGDSPGARTASVRVEDVNRFSVTDFDAWHLDPDRRPEGRRTTRVERHEPGPATVQRLLRECPHAAIKLAPAATTDSRVLEDAELEWIGRARQCRQLVAWFGSLAKGVGQRRATLLGGELADPRAVRTVCGAPGLRLSSSGRIARYLFEPDATVLAAHLEGTLATEHRLEAPNGAVPYFTGDRVVDDPALAAFEVTDVLPLDMRRVRRLMREREIGRLEVKRRGIPESPEEIRKKVQPRGKEAGVLLAFPCQGRVTAVLARRVSRDA